MKKTLVIISILITGFIGYLWWQYPIFDFGKSLEVSPAPEPPAPDLPSKQLLAVAIENSPEGRPQSGLSQAELVIETVTEGGITRFLALFELSKEVEKIGPVRSARPYFLDWVLGFGVPFAHSGASREALEKIETLGGQLKDMNEFHNEKSFWRDTSRKAPYNLYTSTKLTEELVAKKGWGSNSAELGWTIKGESLVPATSTASEISLNFSYDLFAVSYKYERETNSYLRFLAAKPHLDATSQKQITAKNIVVLFTSSSVIDEQLQTINLQTLGSDRAMIFRDGGVLQARWKKESAASSLKLLDADDSLIALNEGPTWIAVIDQHGSVSWK